MEVINYHDNFKFSAKRQLRKIKTDEELNPFAKYSLICSLYRSNYKHPCTSQTVSLSRQTAIYFSLIISKEYISFKNLVWAHFV